MYISLALQKTDDSLAVQRRVKASAKAVAAAAARAADVTPHRHPRVVIDSAGS